MPRPAPWRLDAAAYPHRQNVQTRFQDMDINGHLNNVAFAALFETGRMNFNQALDFRTAMAGRRSVVARVDINYLTEGHYPGDVEIASAIGEIGGRRWEVLAAMFQNGQCIATCDATAVMLKNDDGEGLPTAFRAALAKWGTSHQG